MFRAEEGSYLEESSNRVGDRRYLLGTEEVFDWIRLESGLQFDKVILESHPPPPEGDGKPAAVHIQVDTLQAPRRLAYTGSTGAGTVYTPQTVT